MTIQKRCAWAKDEHDTLYHDTEWGRPEHNDQKLFELLILEGMQAGLTWNLILRRRENMRLAFDGFNPEMVARYDDAKKAELLSNPLIIRNKAKINALVTNAQAFLKLQQEFGSFDAYIWQFTGGQTIQNHLTHESQMPANSSLSETISKDLRKRGFKFVGSTICYSYMQGIGMVNDHVMGCYCYAECGGGEDTRWSVAK